MVPAPTIAECLRTWSEQLQNASESPRLDAEVLLAEALQKNRTYLYTWPEKQLDERVLQAFFVNAQRRQAGEPVAHILGIKEFWSLPLQVNASTLIPRPETELLVELALDRLKPNARVLDLGTGTGAIAFALASERKDITVTAVDASPDAIALAEQNKTSLEIPNVDILQSDWFEALSGRFDLIVSNPPYIAEDDKHLSQGDVRFEPLSALVADDQGLACYALILSQAANYLNTGANVLMEHGWEQGAAVRDIFKNNGFQNVETTQDYSGNDRVTLGVL